MLHPDIAAIDAKNCTPEDMEKLLSDPLMRSLQYQIQHGVQNIELESNKGKQKIKNICVPEGMDQEAYLQQVMAEDNRNKEREAKEQARRKEIEHQVRRRASCRGAARPRAAACMQWRSAARTLRRVAPHAACAGEAQAK